jgi:hypothetical protein
MKTISITAILLLAIFFLLFSGCTPIFAGTKEKSSSRKSDSTNSRTNYAHGLTGYATYYTTKSCQADGNSGTFTASGTPFSEKAMTCALPFRPNKWGQRYQVTLLSAPPDIHPRSIVVAHMDLGPGKGPQKRNVIIDLTPACWKALNVNTNLGKVKVLVEKL